METKRLEINIETWKRYKEFAEELDDDIAINLLMNNYEAQADIRNVIKISMDTFVDKQLFENTEILYACIEGEDVTKNNTPWTVILRDVIDKVTEKHGMAIQNYYHLITYKQGAFKTDEVPYYNYAFIPKLDISVSNPSVRYFIITLAKVFGIKINIHIKWNYSKNAAHPGEQAFLIIDRKQAFLTFGPQV